MSREALAVNDQGRQLWLQWLPVGNLLLVILTRPICCSTFFVFLFVHQTTLSSLKMEKRKLPIDRVRIKELNIRRERQTEHETLPGIIDPLAALTWRLEAEIEALPPLDLTNPLTGNWLAVAAHHTHW